MHLFIRLGIIFGMPYLMDTDCWCCLVNRTCLLMLWKNGCGMNYSENFAQNRLIDALVDARGASSVLKSCIVNILEDSGSLFRKLETLDPVNPILPGQKEDKHCGMLGFRLFSKVTYLKQGSTYTTCLGRNSEHNQNPCTNIHWKLLHYQKTMVNRLIANI